ncbi:MAG: hypothetical protein HN826_10630 [Methylococcales bacterium]|nr:hypothetical protein [Methylococcales bacterium]
MRHFILLFLFISQNSFASLLDLQLGTSIRTDDFSWTIADQDGEPNILSELIWSDLNSISLDFALQHNRQEQGLTATINGYYGIIFQGKNRDDDFLGNDRTGLFSRSFSESEGTTSEFNASIGYRFKIPDIITHKKALITPLFGYQQDILDIEDFNVRDVFSATTTSGAVGKYKAKWTGITLGFDLLLEITQKVSSYFTVNYHIFDFLGEADWLLRSDFQHPLSFQHESDGTGFSSQFGLFYQHNSHFISELSIDYKELTGKNGTDTTFLASGITATTPLNEVIWTSWALRYNLTYQY